MIERERPPKGYAHWCPDADFHEEQRIRNLEEAERAEYLGNESLAARLRQSADVHRRERDHAQREYGRRQAGRRSRRRY